MATQPPPTADAAPPLLVQHADRAPPLGALLAAEVAGVAVETKVDPKLAKGAEPVLVLSGGGGNLEGLAAISRYIAKIAPESSGLYPQQSVADAVRAESFVEFAASRLRNGPGLEGALESLDAFLALRTRLVGDDAPADESGAGGASSPSSPAPSPSHSALSIADFAVWGALQSSGLWPKLKKKFPHAARWHALVGATPGAPELAERHGLAFKSAFQLSRERGAAGLGGGATGSFDIGLPNARKGAVVTRFPPEPSGYLHVGHAKAALLNDFFAKHYEGKMILRFDDTNPDKESTEFTDAILADLKTLGVEYSKLTYTSDYFPQLLELGEALLRGGHAYADDTPMEQMQRERREKIESRCRGRSPDENLALWKEMVAGSEVGRRNCVRFKMDMGAANGTLRDPVAYRCNDTPHWRTGEKYKVYPTYDCACPFVDSLEGVTHALRTSEYKDREEQTKWALRLERQAWASAHPELPALPDFEIWDYSRLAFSGTVMSKRKLLWFVQSGRVAGWDDARFPTVRGVARRGLTVAALRDFILSQGASKNVTLQEFDKLWALNRAVIDPVAPRHVAVRAAGRVRVSLGGAPAEGSEGAVVDVPRHKKNPALGTKKSYRTPSVWLDAADAAAISKGEEVTLMDWGNAIVEEIDAGAGTGAGRLNPGGDVKATKLKLTWLPASESDSVPPLTPLTLVDHGDLLAKKKLEDGEDVADFVNPCSRWEEAAVGDAGMRMLKVGDVVQLERMGFYRVDAALDEASDAPSVVLIRVPDGKKGPGPPREVLERAVGEEAARRAREKAAEAAAAV